jgi:hypothetical protein
MVEGSSGVKRRSRLVLSHSLIRPNNKRPRRDVVLIDFSGALQKLIPGEIQSIC